VKARANQNISGVDFTNVLQAASMLSDPKSAKKNTVKLSVLFALLGSARVKAVRKMYVTSTPGVNIIKFNVQLLVMQMWA